MKHFWQKHIFGVLESADKGEAIGPKSPNLEGITCTLKLHRCIKSCLTWNTICFETEFLFKKSENHLKNPAGNSAHTFNFL